MIPSGREGKWLVYVWSSDLMASKVVQETIGKAQRSFSHFGCISGFQGDFSPLSTTSVIETCVLPVYTNGSENWIVTVGMPSHLEIYLESWLRKT